MKKRKINRPRNRPNNPINRELELSDFFKKQREYAFNRLDELCKEHGVNMERVLDMQASELKKVFGSKISDVMHFLEVLRRDTEVEKLISILAKYTPNLYSINKNGVGGRSWEDFFKHYGVSKEDRERITEIVKKLNKKKL